MLSMSRTLISAISKQNCLGKGNKLFIFPVRVHRAIAIITPAKINIIISFKLQSRNNEAITPAKPNQFKNFNLVTFLNIPYHD